MSTNILMPALSPTMTEGKLARWLVKEGDEVRTGDVIAEIETDKATMEIEAVDEGKLARILVDEGTEGVAVNSAIAVLTDAGESTSVGNIPLNVDAVSVDFTTEEWDEIKLQALRQIVEATLDSPEHHLAYIRKRIAEGGFGHV